MKPKKHKKRTPGQKPLTPSPSQAPETNDLRLRYDSLSALLQLCMAQVQGSEPDKSAYSCKLELTFNGPDGRVPVSQVRMSLTPAQIPSISPLLKNFRPYVPDDAPFTWFEEIKPPGPGQPPGTKAPSSTTRFEDMLNARDALMAAGDDVTQRALLKQMGYPASPPRTLRRWLKFMDVSWADFKQWAR